MEDDSSCWVTAKSSLNVKKLPYKASAVVSQISATAEGLMGILLFPWAAISGTKGIRGALSGNTVVAAEPLGTSVASQYLSLVDRFLFGSPLTTESSDP